MGHGFSHPSQLSWLLEFCLLFILTPHTLESSGKRTLSWENASLSLACRQVSSELSWLVSDMKGPHQGPPPWEGGPEVYKKEAKPVTGRSQ